MGNPRYFVWLLFATLALAGGLRAQLVVDFNAGDGSWKIVDLNWPSGPYDVVVGGPFTPVFSATGGNPGGFITATDRPATPVSYFQAPASFLAALSADYGATVQFDLQPPGVGYFFSQPDIVLTGGGLTLLLNISALQAGTTTTWSTYSFTLAETNWMIQGGGAPNALQFQNVLGSLTAFRIRGEFYDTVSASLDNVRVSAIPESDEAVFLALGLLLLVVAGTRGSGRGRGTLRGAGCSGDVRMVDNQARKQRGSRPPPNAFFTSDGENDPLERLAPGQAMDVVGNFSPPVSHCLKGRLVRGHDDVV